MAKKKKDMTPAQKAAARWETPEERAAQAATEEAAHEPEKKSPISPFMGGIIGTVLIFLVAGFGYVFTNGIGA